MAGRVPAIHDFDASGTAPDCQFSEIA